MLQVQLLNLWALFQDLGPYSPEAIAWHPIVLLYNQIIMNEYFEKYERIWTICLNSEWYWPKKCTPIILTLLLRYRENRFISGYNSNCIRKFKVEEPKTILEYDVSINNQEIYTFQTNTYKKLTVFTLTGSSITFPIDTIKASGAFSAGIYMQNNLTIV